MFQSSYFTSNVSISAVCCQLLPVLYLLFVAHHLFLCCNGLLIQGHSKLLLHTGLVMNWGKRGQLEMESAIGVFPHAGVPGLRIFVKLRC